MKKSVRPKQALVERELVDASMNAQPERESRESISTGLLFEVLRARLATGGDIVVKRPVPAHQSSKRVRALLEREVEAASAMGGVGAPFVLGWDAESGELRRAWVPGTTLAEARERLGAASLSFALAVCGRLMLLLARAHKSGWLVVDISPSNVMITPGGELVILDFGSARRKGSAPAKSQDELDPVSPGFASPEQAGGLPLTPASDVYAAARLVQWLVTGETGRAPYASLAESDLSQRMSRAMLFAGAVRARSVLRACLARAENMRPDDLLHTAQVCAQGAPASVHSGFSVESWTRASRPKGLLVASALGAIAAAWVCMALWRARPAESVAIVQSAWIDVSASPWGTCSVDGRGASPTPVGAPWRVEPGEHALRCVHPSSRAVEQRVSVGPGERAHVHIALNVPGADPLSPEALAEQFSKETP